MDYYNLCKALSYNMESMLLALVMYDIMCQYGIHFIYGESGEKSRAIHSFLSGAPHRHRALPKSWTSGFLLAPVSSELHFSLSYIPQAKQVDGEIL